MKTAERAVVDTPALLNCSVTPSPASITIACSSVRSRLAGCAHSALTNGPASVPRVMNCDVGPPAIGLLVGKDALPEADEAAAADARADEHKLQPGPIGGMCVCIRCEHMCCFKLAVKHASFMLVSCHAGTPGLDWRAFSTVAKDAFESARRYECIAFVDHDQSDTQCAVWRDKPNKKLIIAFRGTSHWKDMITDVSLMQVSADLHLLLVQVIK